MQKVSEESNDYVITTTIPQEIAHNFAASAILVHSVTQAKTKIPITYENRVSNVIGASKYAKKPISDFAQGDVVYDKPPTTSYSFSHLLMFATLGFATFCFILINFIKMDPVEFMSDLFHCRNPCRQRPAQPPRRVPPGAIRQSSIIPGGHNLSQFPQNSFRNNDTGMQAQGAA